MKKINEFETKRHKIITCKNLCCYCLIQIVNNKNLRIRHRFLQKWSAIRYGHVVDSLVNAVEHLRCIKDHD